MGRVARPHVAGRNPRTAGIGHVAEPRDVGAGPRVTQPGVAPSPASLCPGTCVPNRGRILPALPPGALAGRPVRKRGGDNDFPLEEAGQGPSGSDSATRLQTHGTSVSVSPGPSVSTESPACLGRGWGRNRLILILTPAPPPQAENEPGLYRTSSVRSSAPGRQGRRVRKTQRMRSISPKPSPAASDHGERTSGAPQEGALLGPGPASTAASVFSTGKKKIIGIFFKKREKKKRKLCP